MNIIPWRVSHFFNVHFHSLYMLLKFGKTDLNTKKYWNKRFQSDNYHESENTENVFKKMRELITSDSKVLDIGCGTGYFLKSLKNNNITNNIYAVDISEFIIEQLGKEGIQGVCSELPEIPYEDESFDFVTAKALLEHLRTTDETIKSMVRVLRKTGNLLISVPNNRFGPEVEPEHFRKYTDESLKKELNKYVKVKEIKIIDNCLLAICEK